jgi:hypothetical protein
MNLSTMYPSLQLEPKNQGKMVATIFYPDATSGVQWVETFHRALSDLGEADAVDPRPWRLDILEWPEMQAQATHDIACSDIVVVPADNAYASSAFFRRWGETWPTALDGRHLFIVPRRDVVDPWLAPKQQQFINWLQELAGRKGMGLALAGTAGCPIHGGSRQAEKVPQLSGTSSPAHHRLQSMNDYLADWESPPAPRFLGLNE